MYKGFCIFKSNIQNLAIFSCQVQVEKDPLEWNSCISVGLAVLDYNEWMTMSGENLHCVPSPGLIFKTQLTAQVFVAFYLSLPWFSIISILTQVLGPCHSGMTVLLLNSQSSIQCLASPHKRAYKTFLLGVKDLSGSRLHIRMQWVFVCWVSERMPAFVSPLGAEAHSHLEL